MYILKPQMFYYFTQKSNIYDLTSRNHYYLLTDLYSIILNAQI